MEEHWMIILSGAIVFILGMASGWMTAGPLLKEARAEGYRQGFREAQEMQEQIDAIRID
jgi:hypothetical protein